MVTEEPRPEQLGAGDGWRPSAAGGDYYLSTPELNQRLDLLQHLTANSDRIVLVRGPNGIGKTSMLVRFQSLAADHWQLCRIDADPMMQPQQLFATLGGCFNMPSSDERVVDRLVRRFADLHQTGRLPVILVDDAQLLPVATIISLLRLHELSPSPAAPVRIILFATPQIDRLLATSQVQSMNLQALQVMELPALGAEQSEQLVRRCLEAGEVAASRISNSQLAKIYSDTGGIPGEIVNRVERLGKLLGKSHPTRRTKTHGKSWLRLAAGAFVGILLLLVLIYQDSINALLDGGVQKEQELALPPVHREPVLPLQPPVPDTKVSVESPALVDKGAGVPELSLPEVTQAQHRVARASVDAVPSTVGGGTDTQPLETPEQPTPDVASAKPPESALSRAVVEGSRLANLPVTTPREVPANADAPQESSEESASTVAGQGLGSSEPVVGTVADISPPEPQVASVSTAVAESPVTEKAADSASAEDATMPEAAQRVAQEPHPAKPSNSGLRRESWLLGQKASSYTLQLLGVQDEASIERFLRRHGLQEKAAYFRTMRDNRAWFSVVYGIYPDRAAAVEARSSLPGELRDSGVWPRSIASIHQVIRAQ